MIKLILIVTTFAIFTTTALAQSKPDAGTNQFQQVQKDAKGVELVKNPLPYNNFNEVIARFIYIFSILIGSFAGLMIMIGGVKMLLSNGDETAYGEGKKTLMWSILGLLLYTMIFSLIQIVRLLVK